MSKVEMIAAEDDAPVMGNPPAAATPEPAPAATPAAPEPAPATPATTTAAPEPAPPAAPEPTVDVEGEKIPLSQLRKALADAKNASDWEKKNTERSQAIAARERELQQLELLRQQLEQRPDVVEALLRPKPQRDFDGELKALYGQQPDVSLDPDSYQAWALKRDALIREQATVAAQQAAQVGEVNRIAYEHNTTVEAKARTALVATKKVSDVEFQSLTNWVLQNIMPRNGRYPENAYDMAFRAVHEDRYLADVKIAATRNVVGPLAAAVPGSPAAPGVRGTEPNPSPDDAEDNEFVAAIRAKNKGKTKVLPAS